MLKRQLARMQHYPGNSFLAIVRLIAIGFITRQWMPGRGKMHPNLMGSSGHNFTFNVRELIAHHLKLFHFVQAGFPFLRLPFLPEPWDACQWAVYIHPAL